MTKSRQQLKITPRRVITPRRAIKNIQPKEYLKPKAIYELITGKEWNYGATVKKHYGCRDRAMMALTYTSLGRIAAVAGGHRWKWDGSWGDVVDERFDKRTGEMTEIHEGRGFKTGKRHTGILTSHIKITNKFIQIEGMPVVKRSQKLIEKNPTITVRPDFIIPLKKGLYKGENGEVNNFGDQLVPFGWLILEYLKNYAPKEGYTKTKWARKEPKLFPYGANRAWQIVKYVTSEYPHWFRAQAEHFYGHYIYTDTIKFANFLRIVDPDSMKNYMGFSQDAYLMDAELLMDFDWIDREVERIKQRIQERCKKRPTRVMRAPT